MKSKPRMGSPILPGDVIGVEEEFMPSTGSYVDDKGYVRSQLVGRLYVDLLKKHVVVKHVKGKPVIPKPGDIVEGMVASMSDDLAFIDIYAVNDKYMRSSIFTGIIHISQASPEYLTSLYDAFRLGEIVRAKVLNSSHPFQLTTREPGLGVVMAYCSSCGAILYKVDDRLMCKRCGNVEKRKVSSFYIFK